MANSEANNWAKKKWMLVLLPMMKFVMGCMAHMVSVILTSWNQMAGMASAQHTAMEIGVMSMSMVWWIPFFMINASMPPSNAEAATTENKA
jgi:hypothetical protein